MLYFNETLPPTDILDFIETLPTFDILVSDETLLLSSTPPLTSLMVRLT